MDHSDRLPEVPIVVSIQLKRTYLDTRVQSSICLMWKIKKSATDSFHFSRWAHWCFSWALTASVNCHFFNVLVHLNAAWEDHTTLMNNWKVSFNDTEVVILITVCITENIPGILKGCGATRDWACDNVCIMLLLLARLCVAYNLYIRSSNSSFSVEQNTLFFFTL